MRPTSGHVSPGCAHPTMNATHNAVGAWFLGPKAENHDHLKNQFEIVLDAARNARQNYFPNDEVFIDGEMSSSAAFVGNMNKLEENLEIISKLLGEHVVPFFSPRYNAHMNADVTLPAVLGYLTTMLYNQNNVAPEGSPLTSYIEYIVGQQLCSMLGFNTVESRKDSKLQNEPVGWGHITCDGSVANLESIWAARNMKFYPLSLKNAIAEGEPLNFIASTFKVTLCTGEEKLFQNCSTWELLNLTSNTILGIPERLTELFGMSSSYLETLMEKYIIQSVGKDALVEQFRIKQPQYFVTTTNHYSWPKGAAITGIGRDNLIEVKIDQFVRMDCDHLERLLEDRLAHEQAVYAVVAIVGTTEHGMVDPVAKLLEIRQKFQARGLSFLIHCDCAWGGYFTSLLHEKPAPYNGTNPDPDNKYVPALTLLPYTKKQLESLKDVDSITIDPHKSGYIPYPAGGLCYRDERLRFMLTWNSPYINVDTAEVEAMGIYGLEGSKPGASPMAAWLSHEVIGLHKGGYGALLGEAIFSALKMYSHWVTMSYDSEKLTVVPLNMLPAEQNGETPEKVEEQRKFIYDRIVNRPNLELVEDEEAMALVRDMGSDLMINAFACNFSIDGVVNKDVAEANYLNNRIYERLSIAKVTDDLQERPMLIMSTVFPQAKYGVCLDVFKNRLGLEGDEDLYALSNVSMSPFPTAGNFMNNLANTFRGIAEEEIENCYRRVKVTPSYHGFVIQGSDPVYLVYLPMFNLGNHRQQLIVTAKLPEQVMQTYLKKLEENPTVIFTLHTVEEATLSNLLTQTSFKAVIDIGLPVAHGTGHLVSEFDVTDITVVKNRAIGPKFLDKQYPDNMPFFLYGTPDQPHVDHMLLFAPNTQLSASEVKLNLNIENTQLADGLKKGLIVTFDSHYERIMQPFNASHKPSFFASGNTCQVTVYHDPHEATANGPGLLDKLGAPVAKGTLTIGPGVWIDFNYINQDHVWMDQNEVVNLTNHLIGSGGPGTAKFKERLDAIEEETKRHNYAESVRREILAKLGTLYPESGETTSAKDVTPSRYLVHQPDHHTAKMERRKGWKNKFDKEFAKRHF